MLRLIKLIKSHKRLFTVITVTSFFIAQTSSVFGAALIPGFYGSTSSDITAPSVNAIPALKGIVQGVSSLEKSSYNGLVVHQDESSAIIDWDSFNIGANAWVHFDQQENTSWKALNRIYDQSPSLIYGRLTSDGQVYLINQNGIFFSPNSTVNVGSLVASSLNMADDDFLDGTLSFARENYINPAEELNENGVVSNHGTITAADGGSVFLLGTTVENNGEISADLGWAALAAGEEIRLKEIELNDQIYKRIYIAENPGDVYNYEDGALSADLGQAGMYGRTVTQNGIIRSVTAVTNNGRVELLASEKVTLGEDSVTSTPVSSSSEEFNNTFIFHGGEVLVGSLYSGLGDDEESAADDNKLTPDLVELYGTVLASSGNVDIEAGGRIYLGEDSAIDVSGLWVTMPVSEKIVNVQLNSVELADDYGQKDGLLLGETITISSLLGSSIGDVSNYIISRGDLTAEEMATEGGTIYLNAGSGDIIIREGGYLDASGGGVNYSGGSIDTTKLLSVNNVVYDIDKAEEWETYKGILGDFAKIHDRYGVKETYSGIYYGGVAPIKSYINGFQEGNDAGKISLIASGMVLEGTIDASVTQGDFQIYYPHEDEEEIYDAMGISVPAGGTLEIGDVLSVAPIYSDLDHVVQEVVVDSSVDQLPENFNALEPFPEDREGITHISSSLINDAGLGTLRLYSRTGLTIEEDASISLLAGGSFFARARSIVIEGDITVPGGLIDLTLNSNITTDEGDDYVSQKDLGHERIFLASGSSLSVAGEQIDNSEYGKGLDVDYETGLLEGGTILISDETLNGEGVIADAGSSIDVSGGHEIDEDGEVSGGDAGSVHVQGVTIIFEGDLMGYSTQGMNGGSISVHAGNVYVLPDDMFTVRSLIGADYTIPDEIRNTLILDDDFFDNTGFTDITLKAFDGITISSGAVLTPSYIKFTASDRTGSIEDYGSVGLRYGSYSKLTSVTDDYLGDSSIRLLADEEFDGYVMPAQEDVSGTVEIKSGAEVNVGAGGGINLEGRNIEFSGTLSAPGGSIDADAQGITIHPGGFLSAAGYIKRDTEPLAKDLPLGFSAVDGGNVTLKAGKGGLIIEEGAVIDVSGSDAVNDYVWSEDGDIVTVQTASAPGSVTLSFFGDLVMEGQLKAGAEMESLNGGALVIAKENDINPMDMSGEEISSYLSMGFDSITLESWSEIFFTGSMDIDVPRDITIDAPVVSSASDSDISITSPWITLANTYDYNKEVKELVKGDASLTLEGGFIDISGYITLSSFESAELISTTDIRLSDYYYNESYQNTRWGGLEQTGDLVLQADRIYPDSLTSFTIKTEGDLTILDNGDNLTGSIYSAGSNLSLEAANIYLYGDIYAPLGDVTLIALSEDGIVYLGDESTLSTYMDAYINYGLIDDEALFWGMPDKNGTIDTDSEVLSAPVGSVTVEGENVVMAEGAEIDVSGGGTVFAYRFLSGTDGTEDPLGKDDQYVILPENSVYSPGKTIIIGENEEIPAGEYYLLSDEYAFVDGAVILTDIGTGVNLSEYPMTEEGYSVISGMTATAGTDLTSSVETHYYSIRDAEDVLSEGYYEISEMTAGDAGSVTMTGNTTILEGAIFGEALDDTYSGAALKVSGTDIIITAGGNDWVLPDNFDPTGEIHEQIAGEMIDKLVLSDETVSGMGLESIILGDKESTSKLTFEDGVSLNVKGIELNAGDLITINDNVLIAALSEGSESNTDTDSLDGRIVFNAPEGSLRIEDTAMIHASDNIELNANLFDIQGQLQVDNSSISITSDTIYFISDNDSDRTGTGAYITQGLWTYLASSEVMELGEGSEIFFKDSFDLNVGSELVLNASLIDTDDSVINISSGSVVFTNSGNESEETVSSSPGALRVEADEIYLSEGTITFDGFSGIHLYSSGDVTIQGTGAFITGSADLSIEAASVASSLLETSEGYDAINYSIDTGTGAVTIASNGGGYSEAIIAGGNFEITAEDIIQTGVLNMNGADIAMTTSGSGSDSGIFLEDGAIIYAAGNDFAPGGSVELVAEDGIVSIGNGARIDVSAGGQGDAGEIEIVSPTYSAVMEGNLYGQSEENGIGGSFSIDTAAIADLSSLIDILTDGGFNEAVELRAREANIVLASEDTLTASEVKISADESDGQGDIDIYGAIDSSGAKDGSDIALYAGGSLTLYSGSSITGSSSGADITLSGEGGIVFQGDAAIDAGGAEDGSVVFRSFKTDSALNMTLNGSISGADEVTALAVKVYDEDDHDGVIDNEISQWKTETEAYMEDASTLKSEIFGGLEISDGTDLNFVPGLEITSIGDLTVKNAWSLTDWHYDADVDGTGETAGFLYLRAAGDLIINGDITDAPTNKHYLYQDTGATGWNIDLSAGSDLTAANPLGAFTEIDNGDLTINSGVLVYTERGDIGFSSAGDTMIDKVNLNTLISYSGIGYNLSTYDGSISGDVGGSLIINGGAIQSSLGDIDLEVDGDIQLKRKSGYLGTIRSLGAATSEALISYWYYEAGGDINLNFKGNLLGSPSINDGWDQVYMAYDPETQEVWKDWSASFAGNNGLDVSQGIVAMSGGDIYIKAGGDITAGIGNFAEGNLNVYSGGDINGRFVVADGMGELYAAGDFGTKTGMEGQQIELLDANVSLTTGGKILLGSIVNPTLASDSFTSDSSWNLSYTEDTEMNLNAIFGDVSLTGDAIFYGNINQKLKQKMLPASLSIISGRDILFNDSFVLAPSSEGQLYLRAGRDISGEYIENGKEKRGNIYMSDLNADEVYGDKTSTTSEVEAVINSLTRYEHGEGVSHRDDDKAVIIDAGQDIKDIAFYLPKKTEITAERDILDIYYNGQNTGLDDISYIKAGRDISFSSSLSGDLLYTGIEKGGPGLLMVIAGDSIDLGTTDGIQLVGNQYNVYLDPEENDLVVLSGVDLDITLDELNEFFGRIRDQGEIYSEFLAEGDIEGAEAVVENLRREAVYNLFKDVGTGTGDIDMVESQINITGGAGSIYIAALGEINVGKSTFTDSGSVESDSGIYTTAGGDINIFSVEDLNVNESRVMTFAGGDVTVWTDKGNINAGRGSKASVNATESHAVYDEKTGKWFIEWEAPAVGSGIRTLTFDPDGLEGPKEEPLPGDVYLFAPEGEIDAGEAGISGTNVILGAVDIVNAQNISFSQGSVGMPVSTASVNLGVVAGISSITDTTSMVEEATSTITGSREDSMEEAMKALADFITKWLNVEVLGFYEEEGE
ncbi:MAG: filamentous hemagglutinin family protein [Deltaproteobacteria bacterium]|nr:filamentous hemagglutinin family protein [Deltaproteobacteria bacterium]